MPDNVSLFSVSDLTVSYRIQNRQIIPLQNVSIDIPSRSFAVGVVGESGSGKTTLALSMMNLIRPPGRIESGTVAYNGNNVLTMSKTELRKFRWTEVSMVFQSAMNALNPVKRIRDPIVEVLRQHTDISKPEARQRALELLSDVGITADRAGDYPHQMSGGMKQRVAIALAVALSPKLLIADEPTSALDVVLQRQILDLIKRQVVEKHSALVFVTHEITILHHLVEQVVVMYRGEIVEIGPTEDILFESFHPYTQRLISSIPKMDMRQNALDFEVKEDNDGSFVIPIEGCRYRHICVYAFERCKLERPVLRQIQKGRWVSCHKY